MGRRRHAHKRHAHKERDHAPEPNESTFAPRDWIDELAGVGWSTQRASKSSRFRERILRSHLRDATNVDIRTWQRLSAHGLISDEFRRRIWPILLRVDSAVSLPLPHESAAKGKTQKHCQWDQVEKDIVRSLWSIKEVAERDRRRNQLRYIINTLLCEYEHVLHYFQGFHDVCAVFLLTLDDVQMALKCMRVMCFYHLRDFMQPNMNAVITQMQLLYPLLERFAPHVHTLLAEQNVQPFVALPWLLTWFSHTIADQSVVRRIFDLLIPSQPIMIVYVTAAVLWAHGTSVLRRNGEVSATDWDPGELHHQLSKLPSAWHWDVLLKKALFMFKSYPPRSLIADCNVDLHAVSLLPSINSMRWPYDVCDHEFLSELRVSPVRRKGRPWQRYLGTVIGLSVGVVSFALHSYFSGGASELDVI